MIFGIKNLIFPNKKITKAYDWAKIIEDDKKFNLLEQKLNQLDSKINQLENKIDNKIKNLKLIYPKEEKEIFKLINKKISKLIISYSQSLINDINFDIIFSFLYENIKNYIKENDKYKSLYDKFLTLYEETKNKVLTKKIFPMNFLINYIF